MREKGVKLQQAQKLVQYLRECEDVMDWINDKVHLHGDIRSLVSCLSPGSCFLEGKRELGSGRAVAQTPGIVREHLGQHLKAEMSDNCVIVIVTVHHCDEEALQITTRVSGWG